MLLKNMVFGESAPSSPADRNIEVVAIRGPLQGKSPAMENVLGIARDYSDSAFGHPIADVQPDADLTRIVVGRWMQYVQIH